MNGEGCKQATEGIAAPHDHDVLSGRGNFVNYHAGNEHFRALVRKHKMAYVACPKPQKGKFSRIIVDEIRNRHPPGRFLKQDNETKLWYEIGDKKALDKTRQALREGAPEILKDLDPDEEDTEGELSPTQASLQQEQGYGTPGGYGLTPSQYAGLGLGTMPPSNVASSMNAMQMGVHQIPLNHRIVPGMLNIPPGATQLAGLRGSSGMGSLAREIKETQQLQQQSAYEGEQAFEPTPINPNVLLQNTQTRVLPARGIQRDDSLTFENLWTKDSNSQTKESARKKMEGSSQHLSAMSFSIGDMTDASNLSAVFEDSMRISDEAGPLVKAESRKAAGGGGPSSSVSTNLSVDAFSPEARKKPSGSNVDMSLGSLGLESSMMHMSFKSGLDDETVKEER